MAAIQTEILQPSHRKIKIARGKSPVQGQDAQLELYFSEDIENVFTEVKGIVDYKNHLNIPSVKRGDVIAKKTPPVEGQAGYDVYGNVILPDPVKDILIAGKNHVEITPNFIVIAKKEDQVHICV
ncbi:flagellar assembly protein A [Brevibacillus agri]|uniref:flagellar assembly protein A n=1 Tax=Brevibacillus agri TaxID=51101 RepID=UPI0018CF99DB